MTKQETRQLGIEFERRVQQMMPQKEFLDKLDTETIYSFLNQYQDKLIHELFANLGKIAEQDEDSSRIDTLLKDLITTQPITTKDLTNDLGFSNTEQWSLPQNAPTLAQYIRSTSTVDQYYKKGASNNIAATTITNKFVPNANIAKYAEAPNNTLRIMRTPIITVNGSKFVTIHDKYTNITVLRVTYYRNPQYFSPLDNKNCELPIDLFEDLVSGAVALYMQYVVGQNKQDKKEDKENQS